jgi:hypothetical protein
LIALKLMNRKAISPRMAGAAVVLVGLLVGGGAFLVGQASAYPNGQRVHVTGTWVATIEYYLSENGGLAVPYPAGAGSADDFMGTHANFGTLTGGMSGTSSIVLQGDGPSAGGFYESYMGPFVGTVERSSPGSFTTIGSVYCSCNAAPWTLSGTISAVDGSGMLGLADICGGGTFTGTSQPDATGLNGTTFTFTYNATFMFGAQCDSGQGENN